MLGEPARAMKFAAGLRTPLAEREGYSPAGRIGGVRLELVAAAGRTRLGACYQQVPLRVLPAFSFGTGPMALLYLLNPTAGLLDGDAQLVEVTARSGTSTLIVGQSATRIHPAVRRFCTQQWRIRVEAGATLIVLPGPAIPFAGCRYYQRVEVDLVGDARFAWGDLWMAGRYARGAMSERFQFDRIVQEMNIHRLLPSPPVLRGRGVGGEGEQDPARDMEGMDAARDLDPAHGMLPPSPPAPLPRRTGGEGSKRAFAPPNEDEGSKRVLVYRDRFSWKGPWNDETSRWHFGSSMASGSMFLTGNLGEMSQRDSFAESTSPRPEQSVQLARFPTIFGDSCLRWHGTGESALEQLLQLTRAFSPESFLSGVDLAPNHWFSTPLR